MLLTRSSGPQVKAREVPEGYDISVQTRDIFQAPSAVFSRALVQGLEEGQLSGEGFLAIQQQPGVYVANSSADLSIKVLLQEVQPKTVAIARLSLVDTDTHAGASLALEDGSKLQVATVQMPSCRCEPLCCTTMSNKMDGFSFCILNILCDILYTMLQMCVCVMSSAQFDI